MVQGIGQESLFDAADTSQRLRAYVSAVERKGFDSYDHYLTLTDSEYRIPQALGALVVYADTSQRNTPTPDINYSHTWRRVVSTIELSLNGFENSLSTISLKSWEYHPRKPWRSYHTLQFIDLAATGAHVGEKTGKSPISYHDIASLSPDTAIHRATHILNDQIEQTTATPYPGHDTPRSELSNEDRQTLDAFAHISSTVIKQLLTVVKL